MHESLAEHLGIDARTFEGVDAAEVFMLGAEYATFAHIASDSGCIRFDLNVRVLNLDRVMALLRRADWIVHSDVPSNGWARLWGWKE